MDACGSLSGYYLVTLLVRDNFRCWVPCGQFWITKEHSDLYIFAFKTFMQWTEHRWSPSAFLIDGSNIELRAIERTFGGARILRCTRHSTENLKAKLAHVEDVLYHMEKAVFAESFSDCQQNIQNSISKCPYADLKRYLLSKWTLQSSYSWSLHGRVDTPLLREITTINPIESYHSMVRRYTNSNINLKECTFNIVALLRKDMKLLNKYNQTATIRFLELQH